MCWHHVQLAVERTVSHHDNHDTANFICSVNNNSNMQQLIYLTDIVYS